MTISYTSAAAALASLEDSDFKQQSYKRNLEAREYIQSQLDRWNISYPKATANFVHCDVTRFKDQIKTALQEKNIALNPIERDEHAYLRISIGTMQEMEAFVQRMDNFFMT